MKARQENHKPAKRVDIVTLKMVRESSVLYPNRQISSPIDAVDLIKPFIVDSDREVFVIVGLDTKNQPTVIHQVSIGSLNASLCHPREVFKVCFMSNSNALILFHNHPSGQVQPSHEDKDVTKRLVEAGELLGIEVLDHIILGGDDHFSCKERGLM